MHRNIRLIIHLIVVIGNPWWWIIIQRNLLAGLLVFILSFVTYLYFFQNKSRIILLLFITLSMILFTVSIGQAFDEGIFRNSSLNIQQLNKRHEFYANDLGKLYRNRFTLAYFRDYNFPIYKLQSNFFSNLDPNLYFFASHPRERLGIEEFPKYSAIFLPFFIIGILYATMVLLPKLFIYLIPILLISSFVSPNYNLGPLLFFSIINLMITIGLLLSLERVLRYVNLKKWDLA